MDLTVLFNISYGLYLVTSNDGTKDNGAIVNTICQVTNTPNRVAVTISKDNYSHYIIKNTGIMNVNCLTEDTPFKVFENFGFQSGKNVDKFADWNFTRSSNGLAILNEYSNSYISLKVEQYVDLDTHGMFICAVEDGENLSSAPTMTYSYYHKNVKPNPNTNTKKGFVCKICGYVYEGDTLPDDFVCPLCKHGASDFEPLS
ncbi:MAG: flavin reductase [Clostridia bacterium]|nr:flavin reductase [Clostridia bacterium]